MINIKKDTLTQLWNRETIEQYIKSLLMKGEDVTIILGDIDFFVNINCKIGQDEGDKTLSRMAGFFTGYFNAPVARYGGDEFIVVFTHKLNDSEKQWVDEFRKRFRKQKFISQELKYGMAPISISLGVVTNEADSNDLFKLLKLAEIALAKAKKQGRNRVVFYHDTILFIVKNPLASVYTMCGGGLKGYRGDNGQAENASIAEPYGVDIFYEKGLVFADRGNHCVRIVKENGIIETLVGKGVYGYSGDHDFAIKAALNKPSGVAVDNHSNRIYIADTGNHCIRVMNDNGIIDTFAGNGNEGYSGDGYDAKNAQLSRPGGVVVDEMGYVYTNDYGNNVIRMITPDGIIETIAGSGEFGYYGDGGDPLQAAFDRPYGLAVSQNGKYVFVADYGNHCIRMVDLEKKMITTVCGNTTPGYTGDGGDSRDATLNGPFWVALWEDHLLIADSENNCIRMCPMHGGYIETLTGNGIEGYTDGIKNDKKISYNIPAGMVVDKINNKMYIADYGNNAIRTVSLVS